MAEDGTTALDDKKRRESFVDDISFPVYRRRFLILAALSMNYFVWNWTGGRHSIIAQSYALAYDTTNNFDLFGSGELGVDSLTLISAIILVFSYIPCAYVIDRSGIRWMKLGSAAICFQCWLWYLNDAGVFGQATILVALLSKIPSSLLGPLVSSSLLAVSNRWFPPRERAKATATVTLVSTLGSAFATVAGPFFETSVPQIVLSLKNCDPSAATLAKAAAAALNNTLAECDSTDNDAPEFAEFCCAATADIASYGLSLALVSTFVTLFTIVVVTNNPPTPPSPANENVQLLPAFKIAMKHMYQYKNYLKLCAADFIVSGPPIVLLAAIARMLPPLIQSFDFIIAAVGIVLAIPAAVITAYVLDKRHIYWDLTAGGYATGAVVWILVTIVFAIGGSVVYAMIPLLLLSFITFTAWQAAVYETKLEYVFSTEFQIEGLVVGIDRVLINLATALFLPLLAPENLNNDPLNTYGIGIALMVIGAGFSFAIKKENRRKYLRLENDIKLSA